VKPSIRIAAVAAAALSLLGAGAVVAVNLLGPSVVDPETARCDGPPTTFGSERALADHREVDVRFTCEGAVQAATIYLPGGAGRHPALVWIHGAGQASRIPYAFDVFQQLVHSGIAVLSYDKRGVGESEGVCCVGDSGHFNLLTADVVGAVSVLRSRSDIDPHQIGLFGASQAGWIAPRAAVEAHAALLAVASAPTVTERTANLYERLASGEQGRLSKAEISRRLKDAGSPGFDPLPYLKQLTVPGLWEFGTADDRTPVDESIAVLDGLKAGGKDITVAVFPDAGHGLLDTPPTDPNAGPTMIRWILDHLHPAT
jgi:dipeptidyl aminopeptidase/acylaminoacyl peptidase